jgi:hypothetical protein
MTTATRPSTIEKQLLEKEHQYWQAIQDRDSRKLGSLTADTFTFVMGDGVHSFSRDQYVTMMTGSGFKMTGFDIDLDNATIRELAPNTALVAFKSHWRYERDGAPGDSRSFTTSIWIKSGTRWQCAFDTETGAS